MTSTFNLSAQRVLIEHRMELLAQRNYRLISAFLFSASIGTVLFVLSILVRILPYDLFQIFGAILSGVATIILLMSSILGCCSALSSFRIDQLRRKLLQL